MVPYNNFIKKFLHAFTAVIIIIVVVVVVVDFFLFIFCFSNIRPTDCCNQGVHKQVNVEWTVVCVP